MRTRATSASCCASAERRAASARGSAAGARAPPASPVPPRSLSTGATSRHSRERLCWQVALLATTGPYQEALLAGGEPPQVYAIHHGMPFSTQKHVSDQPTILQPVHSTPARSILVLATADATADADKSAPRGAAASEGAASPAPLSPRAPAPGASAFRSGGRSAPSPRGCALTASPRSSSPGYGAAAASCGAAAASRGLASSGAAAAAVAADAAATLRRSAYTCAAGKHRSRV